MCAWDYHIHLLSLQRDKLVLFVKLYFILFTVFISLYFKSYSTQFWLFLTVYFVVWIWERKKRILASIVEILCLYQMSGKEMGIIDEVRVLADYIHDMNYGNCISG